MASLLTAAVDASCSCPACHEVLRVNLSAAGRLAKCRRCGKTFKVPTRQELIDHAAALLIADGVEDELQARQSQGDRRLADQTAAQDSSMA